MGLMNIRIYAAGYLATDKRHGREIPVTFGINEIITILKFLNNKEGYNNIF